MKADKYRFDGSDKCRLSKLPTNSKQDDGVRNGSWQASLLGSPRMGKKVYLTPILEALDSGKTQLDQEDQEELHRLVREAQENQTPKGKKEKKDKADKPKKDKKDKADRKDSDKKDKKNKKSGRKESKYEKITHFDES